MTHNVNDSDGAQALDYNTLADRYQYSVASGCAVSVGSGTLGNADTLSLASGEVIHDGSTVSVSSQGVGIAAANAENPRKDVVYLDSNGDAQVAQGTPEAKDPSDANRFETFRPAPLDLSATQATVVAEVWVPAAASSITSSDLRDRRVFADATFVDTTHRSVSVGEARIGSPEQSAISNETATVTVPGDYDSVEDALKEVHPFITRHSVEIQITEDTTEDIYVPPAVTRRVPLDVGSESLTIDIIGDGRTQVGSIFADTVLGMGLGFHDLEVTGANPYTNEDAAIGIYGCVGRVQVSNVDITHTGKDGIISYSSNVTVNNIDLGTGLNTGVDTKHMGTLYISGGGLKGNVSNVLCRANTGMIHIEDSVKPLSATSDDRLYKSEGGGIINGSFTEGLSSGSYQQDLYDINGNSISLTSGYVVLREGDSTTLETINGGEAGTEITLRANDTITIAHQTDNIYLDGQADFTMDHPRDHLKLILADTGHWCEVGRGDNS